MWRQDKSWMKRMIAKSTCADRNDNCTLSRSIFILNIILSTEVPWKDQEKYFIEINCHIFCWGHKKHVLWDLKPREGHIFEIWHLVENIYKHQYQYRNFHIFIICLFFFADWHLVDRCDIHQYRNSHYDVCDIKLRWFCIYTVQTHTPLI